MQRKDFISHTCCAKTGFFEVYGAGDFIALGLPRMLLRRDLPCSSIDISAVTRATKPHITISKEIPNVNRGFHGELMRCLQEHIESQNDEYMDLQFDRHPHMRAGTMMFLIDHCTLAILLKSLHGIIENLISRVAPESFSYLSFSAPHVTLAAEDIVMPLAFTEKSEEYRWHLQSSPDMKSSWWLDWITEKIYFNVHVDDVNLSTWLDPATGLRYEYDKRTRSARCVVDEEACDVIAIPYQYDLHGQFPIAGNEI